MTHTDALPVGPGSLIFICGKAWSTDAGSVKFFDFEMVDRYGFTEFACE